MKLKVSHWTKQMVHARDCYICQICNVFPHKFKEHIFRTGDRVRLRLIPVDSSDQEFTVKRVEQDQNDRINNLITVCAHCSKSDRVVKPYYNISVENDHEEIQ